MSNYYSSNDSRVSDEEFTELVNDAKAFIDNRADIMDLDDLGYGDFEEYKNEVGLLDWMLRFDEDDPENERGEEFTENELEEINHVLRYAWSLAAHEYELTHVKIPCGRWYPAELLVGMMDDDLREELHFLFAPCTEQFFADAYAIAHENRFGETWAPYSDNPQL